MLHQYLVGLAHHFEENMLYEEGASQYEGFAIVDAASSDEAIEKYVRHILIDDEKWLEQIYDTSFNLSFAETFWLQGHKESAHFMKTGQPTVSLEQFEQRVRNFFGSRQDFAERYLEFFRDSAGVPIADLVKRNSFPPDMQVYMWVHNDWGDVITFQLDMIRRLD